MDFIPASYGDMLVGEKIKKQLDGVIPTLDDEQEGLGFLKDMNWYEYFKNELSHIRQTTLQE